MALEHAGRQFAIIDSEQAKPLEPGYMICREANGGYSITIDRRQLYFESMSELNHFLDRSAWSAPPTGEQHPFEKPPEPICPLHGQTGVDGVCDFDAVLARLSAKDLADFNRERDACYAELER